MSTEAIMYIEIDLFCMVFMMIMWVNLIKARSSSGQDKAFFWGITAVNVILLTDILSTALNGRKGFIVYILLYVVNTTYFIFSGIVSYACLLYVDYTISDRASAVDSRVVMYSVPMVMLTVLSLISPRFHYLFFICEDFNHYHRGDLHIVQQIITTLYFVVAFLYSLAKYFTAKNESKRAICRTMIQFVSMPFVGLALQILFPEISIIWPMSSVGLFIVFANLQNSQISTDSLTGLNNRSRLIKYIQDRCDKYDGKQTLICTVYDIDNFKSINDRYGHAVGDEAIKEVADLVKKSIGDLDGSHFIARYTGNSFATISQCSSDITEEIVKRFNDKLQERNDSTKNRYQISVSMGNCIYVPYDMSTDDFLKYADNDMYRHKNEAHAAKHKLSVEDVVK